MHGQRRCVPELCRLADARHSCRGRPNKKSQQRYAAVLPERCRKPGARREHITLRSDGGAGCAGDPILCRLTVAARNRRRIITRIEGYFLGHVGILVQCFPTAPRRSPPSFCGQGQGLYRTGSPRTTCRGWDVARKLIILGREMGLTLENGGRTGRGVGAQRISRSAAWMNS